MQFILISTMTLNTFSFLFNETLIDLRIINNEISLACYFILRSNKSYESIHKCGKRDSVQAQVIFLVFFYKIVEHTLCSRKKTVMQKGWKNM